MSTPLSPSFSFNSRTPSSARHRAFSNLSHVSPKSPLVAMDESGANSPSSPFISLVDQENQPPRADSQADKTEDLKLFDDEKTTQSVRKASADILSPIKTSRINSRSPSKHCSPQVDTMKSPHTTTPIESEPTLRDNQGLTVAIDAMEAEKANATFSDISYSQNPNEPVDDEADGSDVDNTCFSTFSEIPNADMTMFSKLGNRSPTKQLFANVKTPRKTPGTPGTARKREYHGYDRSPSPTPRRRKSPNIQKEEGDTTNLLLDFTEQFHAFSGSSRRSPTKRHSPSKSAGGDASLRNFLNNQRSPAKNGAEPSTPGRRQSNLMNLLDFELPPMPTPRSVPTITVREMESMKSTYQSQISSLTATLSGRAAEVESLKKAVADAERRVGEAQEQVREETSAREHAEREKAEWERRGVEVEEVLRSIREEVVRSDREREVLLHKLEASDRRAEEAEARAAESQTRALEAEGRVVDQSVMTTADAGDDGPRYTADQVQRQIDEKVATLCRELHVVYKKKHETKVAALKKSYEAKGEKKHAELAQKVEELSKHIEELQSRQASEASSSSSSGSLPEGGGDLAAAAPRSADLKRLEEQQAELEAQKARLASLAGEIEAARAERALLQRELDAERREKGELVAAVDEMLALQAADAPTPRQRDAVEDFRRSVSGAAGSSSVATPRGRPDGHGHGHGNAAAAAAAGPAEFRASGIGKPSGLRGPGFGFGESRIGRGGGAAAAAAGVSRGVPKSRMMSNIERMGMGGRGAQE